jgi:hypothetical protein
MGIESEEVKRRRRLLMISSMVMKKMSETQKKVEDIFGTQLSMMMCVGEKQWHD